MAEHDNNRRRVVISWAVHLLEGRRAPCMLCALSVLVVLPSLWAGYYQDDHLLRLRFQGFPHLAGVQGSPLDAFVFGDGDPAQNHIRMDRGIFPWWTPQDWKIAFWRPLAALTHYADWLVLGDRAWVMHLHNLIWYAALVLALACLYRRLLAPQWAAGVAALLFLLDATHALPVGWISMRNAVMSGVFVVLTLYHHDRWRRDRSLPSLFLACAALACGLLSAEAAIGAGAYLAAYALFIDRGRPAARLASLLPFLGIVLVWRIAYDALGYGVTGSLLYTDPVHQPMRFVSDTMHYLPVLLFCQFAASDPMVWNFLPWPWTAVYLGVACTFLLLVLRVLWPLVRRDATARFWATGAVLSTLPLCATMPEARLLVNPGIGAMALIAQYIAWHATRPRHDSESRGRRLLFGGMLGLWVFLHGVVSAISLPVQSYVAPTATQRIMNAINDSAPTDEALSSQTLLIVCTPADLIGATFPVMRAAMGKPVPQYCRTLAAGVRSLELERTGDHTLRARLDDTFMTKPLSQFFCNPATRPMLAEQTVELTGMTIEVLKVNDRGIPKEIAFQFDRPLEDPSLRWVVFQGHGYKPFLPPRPGERVMIAGPTVRDIVQWFLD